MIDFIANPGVNEPFSSGRSSARLLFDFSIMLSCIKEVPENKRILDFACGTGWITEFLSRAGFNVYGFDISSDVVELAKNRADADKRLDANNLSFFVSDGHSIAAIEDGFFSNIVCFDSLHHMADFDKVFSEMFRILAPGGRAVFVEPGSRHSTSKETVEFVEKYKKHDPTWLERDIVIEEINKIAESHGFETMRLRPFLLPEMVEYSLNDWLNFNDNKSAQEQYIKQLRTLNYEDRVIFYLDKK